MPSERSLTRVGVRPNRLALVAIISAGSGLALVPYFLFINRIPYLGVAVAVAAVTALFSLRGLETEATEEPSIAEWLLAAWSAVAHGSTAGLGSLMMYGVAFGGAWLVGYLARLAGFNLHPSPARWGYWGSIAFASVLVVTAAQQGAESLLRSLYPGTAGSRSAFFPLLGKPGRIALVVVAALAALAVILVFLDPRGTAFPIVLMLLFFYTSYPLAELGERRPARLQTEIIESLCRLLEAGGYSVIRSPRTGKPEVDPLIQSIDLLARSRERAFALEVKSRAAGAAVEWNEAAAVRTASSLLEDEMGRDLEAPMPIEPILVVVGGEIAPSLTRFSEQERVPVIHFADAAMFERDLEEVAGRFRAIGVPLHAQEPASSLGAS